ncbi:RNA12 protein-domain-containing protein [Gongronella butleri]|nr:RNA12 protein-domain-containing protein [Gongronella butleri]
MLPYVCRTSVLRSARHVQHRAFRASRLLREDICPPSNITNEASNLVGNQEHHAFIYLDNVYPLRMNSLDFRQYIFMKGKASLENLASRCIPEQTLPHNFRVLDVMQRSKDGGAIVKFAFDSGSGEKEQVALDIAARVNSYLQQKTTRAGFNFQPVRSFLVKGQPFLEDIVRRYPSQRLRVEFQGNPVSVEQLYSHFREYGRIYDISIYPNPMTGKDPARYAVVQYTRMRFATSARNCLHGHVIQDTRLNILYEPQLHTNVVKDWVMNHPRISIPVAAALAAGITYAIFDPVREFCVTSKITRRFNPNEYTFYQWLRRETWSRLLPHTREEGNLWAEDPKQLQQFKSWFRETPETFVVVHGPSGSGKSELVKAALAERKNKLVINCEQLVNARNKADRTKQLAKQVGYFPVFTWVASLGHLMDTLIAATTGGQAGAGFSATPESQNRDILELVAVALADVMPMERAEHRRRVLARQSWYIRLQRRLASMLGEGKQDDDALDAEDDPDFDAKADIPVIFIDDYMRDATKNTELWDDLASWASLVVRNGLAHVVFVSANAGVSKQLAKVLPGRSFNSINLLDAPEEVALEFLSRHLNDEEITDELRDIVQALGGRLTELESLVQKLKLNMTPRAAFDDIVQRNVIEIRKYGFGEMVDDEEYDLDWSLVQFWEIVKLLTQTDVINYDDLKWSDYFEGKDKPIRAMEHAELINILHCDGRPDGIRPGKPVYYTVFKRLLEDKVFAASMEIESATGMKKIMDDKLAKLQQQVIDLSQTYGGKPPKEIDTRIRYLLGKIKALQTKVDGYEKTIKDNKALIVKFWDKKKGT